MSEKIVNPLAGHVLVSVIDCDTNSLVATAAIHKSNLDQGINVGGVCIQNSIEVSEEESWNIIGKTRNLAGDLYNGVARLSKATVVATSHGLTGVKGFLSSAVDGIKTARTNMKEKVDELAAEYGKDKPK